MLSVSMLCVLLFNWTHEGNKLAWNNPIEITILHTLIVLILFNIEGPEVIPSKSHGKLKSLQTMEERAIVEALTF